MGKFEDLIEFILLCAMGLFIALAIIGIIGGLLNL